MLTSFIELTLFTSGRKVLVNMSHIGDIVAADRGGTKITYWRSEVDDFDIWVIESYDEIVALIEKYWTVHRIPNEGE